MTATPETFKPGERWLVASNFFGGVSVRELECVRWSESGKYVKVRKPYWDSEARKEFTDTEWLTSMPELLERLPDVESGNHKTEPPHRLEADSLIRFARLLIVNWPCRCGHCKVQKAKAYTRTEEAESDIFTNAETKA